LSWFTISPLLHLNPLSSIHFPTSCGVAFQGSIDPSVISCCWIVSNFAGLSIPLSSNLLALFPIRFLAFFPTHQRAFHTRGKAAPIQAPTHISETSVPSPFTALKSTISLAPSNPLFSIFQTKGAFWVS
jgi:hypothetical protein